MKGQEKLEPKKKKGELFLSSFSTSKWIHSECKESQIIDVLWFWISYFIKIFRLQSIEILIDSQPYLWIAIA